MNRHLIQNGRAYLSSLPIEWVREHNLNAKDELEIEMVGKKLIISPKENCKKSVKLDVRNSSPVIKRFISAVYRMGYDEVEVLYNGDCELKTIQDTVDKNLFGYEVVEQTNSRCTIKDLSAQNTDSFDNLLKKTFFMLVTNAKDCKKGIETKDYNLLKEVVQRDKSINKLTNFCERLLVKKAVSLSKNGIILYNFVHELENLADEYKFLAIYAIQNKNVDLKGVNLLNKINLGLEKVYHLFYDFNKEKAAKLETEFTLLRNEIAKYKNDFIFEYRLMNIFRRMVVMLGTHYCLKLGE